jgi:nitrogen-specific signal transduction histidine kinase
MSARPDAGRVAKAGRDPVRLALGTSMLHNRRGSGDGDNELARRRGSLRAGGLTAAAVCWPCAAGAADAASGAGSLLLAVTLGAAIAIMAVVVVLRGRDRRSTEPAREALAASCAFWWRTDTTGYITDVGPGRLAAGMDIDALRGRLLWEPVEGAALPDVETAFREGLPFASVACPAATVGGTPLTLTGGPVLSSSGALLGYAGTAQGAAAATEVPIAPAADLEALQDDLDSRNRELAERTRELDNAVRELDSFAYSVSHDLRAPLRIIAGFATIVLEDYSDRGKPLDDVGRDHLRRIVAASQRMNTMIDTLLGLSRMTSRELKRERVDLSQIARELTEDLRAQDTARTVQFVVAPDLRTDGDSTLLRLVLQNLLGNAYKFTARNRAARVEFGARADGGTTAYFVKDNGAGFDMRFAEKLFGLFQRLHSANEFQGTGVGLATVQKIVRRHGGRVWAEAIPAPNEGHGATFFFTLWEDKQG